MKRLVTMCAIGGMIFPVGRLYAATTIIDWNNPGGGLFTSPTNWSPQQVPDSDDIALFDLGSMTSRTILFGIDVTNLGIQIADDNVVFSIPTGRTYTLTGVGGLRVVVFPGDDASLTLVNGGSLAITGGSIGGQVNSTGSLTVANSVLASPIGGGTQLDVGGFGHGTLAVTGPLARVTGQGLISLGNNVTGVGAMTVNAGTVAGSNLTIGGLGQGTVSVTNGGDMMFSGGVSLGSGTGGWGDFTVDGPGTSVDAQTLLLGNLGDATMQVINGATVTVQTTLDIASFDGSTGFLHVTGQGSSIVADGPIRVGGRIILPGGGQGTLRIDPGALVQTPATVEIDHGGTVRLDGGTLSVGALSRAAGGVFQFTSGTLQFNGASGVTLGAFGSVPNLTVPSNSSLIVDHNLRINQGGALVLSGGSLQAGSLQLAGGSLHSSATINLDTTGGLTGTGVLDAPVISSEDTVITATGPLTLGSLVANYAVAGTLNIGANPVTLLDFNTATLGKLTTMAAGGRLSTFRGALLQAGSALNVTGAATITGEFINEGLIDAPQGENTFLTFVDAVRGGRGGFTGNVRLLGDVDPGNDANPVGRFEILNPQFTSTSRLLMDLGGTTGGALAEFDQLLSQWLNLHGTLEVRLVNDFIPQAGDSFNLFVANEIFGHFDELILPELSPMLAWDTSALLTEGDLTVILSFIRGDMDGNGVVDAFDVDDFELALADRDTYGQMYPELDPDMLGDFDGSGMIDAFDVSGFESALAGTDGMAEVPEPGGLAIIASGLLISAARRCRTIHRLNAQ